MMRELPSPRPHELRLDLPAAHSAERMARAVLRQFARKERVPANEIETMEFVASELLSNAVDHGGGGRAMEESDLASPVRITLFVAVERDTWTIAVGDQGGGDPKAIEAQIHGAGLPDLEDERGRGFFLLNEMLSSLHVRRSNDGLGVEFVATRRYSAGA